MCIDVWCGVVGCGIECGVVCMGCGVVYRDVVWSVLMSGVV